MKFRWLAAIVCLFWSGTCFAHDPDLALVALIFMGGLLTLGIAGIVALSKNIELARTVALAGLGLIVLSFVTLGVLAAFDVVYEPEEPRQIALAEGKLVS